MSDLQKRLQMSRLPPMPPPGVGASKLNSGKKGFGKGRRDYTPVTWQTYFSEMHDVVVGENKFCYYQNGEEGPLCLFLHGGGFSALSWAVLSKDLVRSVKCRCAAVDLRGHGDTYTENDSDLSIETLSNDVGKVVEQMYGEEPPPIILVGHSMGGAIAVHVAYKKLLPSLIGLAVIDVVEGTALEALNTMQSFLRNRPSHFKSVEHAIEWSVRTGHIRNIESAKVSMLGQIKKSDTDETATAEISHKDTPTVPTTTARETISEENEDEEDRVKPENQSSENQSTSDCKERSEESNQNCDESDNSSFKKPQNKEPGYTWRIDLSKTEPFWRGWFQGLSSLFLSCTIPKILLLAGVDRLDRDLTLGQMQGKFQMQVLPQCGHAVHEDVPEKVADVLATFMVRHKVAEPNEGFQRTFPAC